MHLNTPFSRAPREDGFTLIELMITMLIVTVGMLGLAKLQAAAVAETSMSRTRALMSFQAESLAGMMRANNTFWIVKGAGPFPSFTVTSAGAISNTSMSSPPSGDCVTPAGGAAHSCPLASQLAYDDMYTWAGNFVAAFPNATANVTCKSASGGACAINPTVPHGYDIVLTWPERIVAINRSTVNSGTTTARMVMHVQP